jgi:hypothetical protein
MSSSRPQGQALMEPEHSRVEVSSVGYLFNFLYV